MGEGLAIIKLITGDPFAEHFPSFTLPGPKSPCEIKPLCRTFIKLCRTCLASLVNFAYSDGLNKKNNKQTKKKKQQQQHNNFIPQLLTFLDFPEKNRYNKLQLYTQTLRKVSFFTRMGGRLFVTSYRQFFLVPPFDRRKKKLVPLTNKKRILVPPSDKTKKILVPPFQC